MTRAFGNTDVVAFDYETTGLVSDPLARVFSVSFCWVNDGYTEIYRKENPLFQKRIDEFFESGGEAVAHNLKFELHMSKRHGWHFNNKKILHDTMIQHQYVDNLSPRHGLDFIAYRYAGHCESSTRWRKADSAVSDAFKIYGRYDKIPEYLMHPYQIADAERGALIHAAMFPSVAPLSEYENEIKLLHTTVRMENRGFTLDRQNADLILADLFHKLEANQSNTKKIAGEINLLSELQVKHLLFDKLKLPRQENIDEDALNEIAKTHSHPILDCIIRARSFTKGFAMISGYKEFAEYDGRMHPDISTDKAQTGRGACAKPNGQNVSKEIKAGVKYPVPARKCFRSKPQHFLVTADYSGVEMRLGAQGTESKRLIEMCKNDFDFHDAFAKSIYGKRYTDEKNKEKKKALRGQAKNGRFAMFYGAGPEVLSNTLGIEYHEAVAGLERDRSEFPELYEFMNRCTKIAQAGERVETFFGRKLRVPHDRPYAATDYVIQGSAAALFKHAQNAVDDYLRSEIGDELCGILLPVHDEIVMEFHRSLLPKINLILKNVKHLMIDWPEIKVKLNIDFAISMRDWGSMREYKLD